MSEKKSIFREKSLEKVSSPEQLDTYLKVTSVGVWAILIAIIVFLIGVIVWGSVGKIESSVTSGCLVEDGVAYCFFKESDALKVDESMSIVIEESENPVLAINLYGQYRADVNDAYLNLSGAEEGEYVYIISSLADVANGIYKGKIVIEEISPLKFVFN